MAAPAAPAALPPAAAAPQGVGPEAAIAEQMPPTGAVADENSNAATDLDHLLIAAKLPPTAVAALTEGVTETAAVHIQELTREHWQQFSSWTMLKPLERRRLLKLVPV